MTELLSLLQSFPPGNRLTLSDSEYHRCIKQFVKRLDQIPLAKFAGPDAGIALLDALDPSINSTSYLAALLGQCRFATIDRALSPGGPLWQRVAKFLHIFDLVQVRYLGNMWRELVHAVERAARVSKQLTLAIPLLFAGMSRLDPSLSVFTSTHLTYMRICMETRACIPAINLLENRNYSFPTPTANGIDMSTLSSSTTSSNSYITTRSVLSAEITPADVQEYFLLGAMIYIAMKDYDGAKHQLENVLITPTADVATGLMLEAYRKWLLVTLLATGKPGSVLGPRSASVPAMRLLRTASKAYEAVGQSFKSRDSNHLRLELEAGESLWEDDGNKGLTEELLQSVTRYWVSDLSLTYAAVPVEDIASWLSQDVSSTETYLRDMIGSKQLAAVLTTAKNLDDRLILRFQQINKTDGEGAVSDERQHAELREQTARIEALAEKVRQADQRATLTKEYIDFLRRTRDRKATAADDAMDTGLDSHELVEDLMADLR